MTSKIQNALAAINAFAARELGSGPAPKRKRKSPRVTRARAIPATDKTVQAIRAYQQQHNCSLSEAFRAVKGREPRCLWKENV